MSSLAIKQLKIKSSVVKRITKEVHYYEKEVEKEKQRLDKMRNEGKDDYALKYQEKVIRESESMIPHCKHELQQAYKELNTLLESEAVLKETEEYLASEVLIADALQVLTQ